MRLTFLGTGTSFGVPVVGCTCPVCTSTDVRNRRSRHGLILESDTGTLLVDTPPELRLQLLAADISHVDAVLLTHTHADHTHGIDDLRVFSVHGRSSLPVHVFTASSRHPLPLHCLFTVSASSLPLHCLFTASSLSLPLHCLFTASSLPLHVTHCAHDTRLTEHLHRVEGSLLLTVLNISLY